MTVLRWLARPWLGVREARRHLASSQADQAEVRELAADMRQIREENHISARVHAAMRGGREWKQ